MALLSAPAGAAAPADGDGLTLADCVRIGLANNLSVSNAYLDAEAAAAIAAGSRAVYDSYWSGGAEIGHSGVSGGESFFISDSDRLGINASYSRAFTQGSRLGFDLNASRLDSSSPVLPLNPFHTAEARLSLTQPLWRNADGGNDRRRIAIAEQGRLLAEIRIREETDALILQIVDAYWGAFERTMIRAAAVRSLGRARELLKNNRAKFDDGLLDETDILAAEASIADREADLLGLRHYEELSVDQLRVLIRLPGRDDGKAAIHFPSLAVRAPAPAAAVAETNAYRRAEANRPDMELARRRLRQIEMEVALQEEELRNDLDFVGSMGLGGSGDSFGDSLGLDEPSWSLGLRLTVPLQKTAGRSRLRQSRLALRQAENDLAGLRDRARLECREALRVVDLTRQRLDLLRRAAELKARRLELEEKKFKQGRSATHWIIQYQDELAQAEVDDAIAVSRYELARVRLQYVQGVLQDQWRRGGRRAEGG